MGLLRGSQSNLTREARALTQRGHEREKMEGTAQAFQGSQSGERPVSSTLATGCHTSDHSSQELKTPTLRWTVARAGMRQTLQPSFVHLPGLKPSFCNPFSQSCLLLGGLQLCPWPSSSAGRLVCNQGYCDQSHFSFSTRSLGSLGDIPGLALT